MKKIKRNNRVPAYAFGLSQGIDASTILGTTLQGAGGTAGDVGGLLSSTGSMAGAGMAVGGPIGAAVGGGLGLITGGIGLINKNKAKKRAERRTLNINNQKLADANTASMMEDYYGENQLANTFAMGGIMPGSPAYVDNGELIKTPDGSINEVTAGRSGVTDDVLTNLPQGSSILSDKIKVPGTNKTFAQMGKGLQRKIKNKDAFAMNSEKLNAMHFDRLLAYQEQLKEQQGITNNTKGIPAYNKGLRGVVSQFNDITPKVLPMDYQPVALPGTTPLVGKSLAQPARSVKADMPSLTAALNTKAYGIANKNDKPSFDYSNLASLAPTLYNIGKSFAKPEVESVTNNPYTGNVNRLMSNRRMNVQPALNANRRGRAISNYNLSQLNTNTGANLAARSQMAAGEYASNADLYSNMQNANNAYMGEQAQMLGNLGNQYVSNKMTIDDINARNRAARRNYGSTAASQLGQWSQTQQLMKNAANRDDLMMPFLMENLGQGFTSDLINQLRTKYYGNK